MNTAGEIIAPKCPKPGCGAMRLVNRPCRDWDCPQGDLTVREVLAEGWTLTPPGGVHAPTLEEAAKVADCECDNPFCERDEIADAIRALASRTEREAKT